MSKCDYEIQLTDTGEILRCIMDEHPGASVHSTVCEEFRKVGDGLFMVRQFADGLRPQWSGRELIDDGFLSMNQQAHGKEVR